MLSHSSCPPQRPALTHHSPLFPRRHARSALSLPYFYPSRFLYKWIPRCHSSMGLSPVPCVVCKPVLRVCFKFAILWSPCPQTLASFPFMAHAQIPCPPLFTCCPPTAVPLLFYQAMPISKHAAPFPVARRNHILSQRAEREPSAFAPRASRAVHSWCCIRVQHLGRECGHYELQGSDAKDASFRTARAGPLRAALRAACQLGDGGCCGSLRQWSGLLLPQIVYIVPCDPFRARLAAQTRLRKSTPRQ